MLVQILRLSELEQMHQRTLALLDKDVKVIDGRAGWHQFIGEERIGYVATAQAMFVLKYLKRQHRLIDGFRQTLRQSQIHDTSNLDCGGWSFLTGSATPTVEPTAWSILGLLVGGEPPNSDTVCRGVEWLKKNQNPDGGWGPREGLNSRVYPTFMAVRCLSELKPYSDISDLSFRDAQRWLLGSQNEDGGWGATSLDGSTPVHTSFAVITLITLGIDHSAMCIQRAIRCLYSYWNSETMWEHTQKFEQYEIPKQDMAWIRITFHYFPSPHVITALLCAGEDIFREELFSGVKWIIRNQNPDGSWTVEGVPRKRLWAIHDAILAAVSFIDRAISTKTIDRMVLLDEIVILTRGPEGRGLARLAISVAAGLMFLGSIIGAVLGSAFGIHQYIGTWVQNNWAWILLGLYIASVFPLVRLRIISLKEAVIGVLLPALLVVIQLYLNP